MVDLRLAPELAVQQYAASLDINPDNVFYQRIPSNNISTELAQWTVQSPSPLARLMSLAWVNWKPTITRVNTAGAAEAVPAFSLNAAWKEGLPFTNAMTNIQSTLNSGSQNWTQPRHYSQILTTMFAGREGSRRCLSTAGGEMDGMEGQQSTTAAGVSLTGSWLIPDHATRQNERRFVDKMARSNGGAITQALVTDFQVNCMEPLFCPPFNPYAKLKKDMPDYCWFKHMSDMIPHVRTLDITCNFQNLEAGTMVQRYINGDGINARLTISALAADLILYWYRPPPKMTLPMEVSIGSWWVREHTTPVSAGAAVPNFPAANSTITGVVSDLIQLFSVPTLIVIHAEVDKNSTSYSNRALQVDVDMAGGGPFLNPAANSLDSYMEISQLQVLLGDHPQVISTSFTQDELYYLTLKNSKMYDFPYTFEQWRGMQEYSAIAAAGAGALATRGGKMFVALRPKDLSEKFGAGVRYPTSLQFQMNLTARDGVHLIAGGNKIYRLYIHLFYGKRFLTLSAVKAEYSEQQISLEAADKKHSEIGGGLARQAGKMSLHSRMGRV